MEKLRWKFVQSSCAFQRHHSTNDVRTSFLRFFDSFLSVSTCTSALAPLGTKRSRSARTPFFAPAILV